MEAVGSLNSDLEATQPWKVAKAEDSQPTRLSELDALLVRHMVTARIIARAAQPIVPDLSARLVDQLGTTRELPEPMPAFTRLDVPEPRS
jgi:methionyl-tRNA synthetase